MRRRRNRGWWKGVVAGWLLLAVLGGVLSHAHHQVPQPGPSWYQVAGTMQNGGQGAVVAQPASSGHAGPRVHVRVPYVLRPHRVLRLRRPWRRWWLRRARRAVLGF